MYDYNDTVVMIISKTETVFYKSIEQQCFIWYNKKVYKSIYYL
ncbi:hypothetical protein MCSV2_130009 [Mucispirillum schaedleri ASF457]|nr:hypothetical protein MCSV2_130009 [Mucispirillum schaedleri ASF457]